MAWSLVHLALARIPVRHPNSCGYCNSTTTGLIHAISNSMDPWMCNSMVIHSINPWENSGRAPKFLWMFHNHLTDLTHLKFYGTVVVQRCAVDWSLAHRALAGIPVRHPNYCICGNSTTDGPICVISSSIDGFPSQRASYADICFGSSLNKLFNKWWMIWGTLMFLWHHCNDNIK